MAKKFLVIDDANKSASGKLDFNIDENGIAHSNLDTYFTDGDYEATFNNRVNFNEGMQQVEMAFSSVDLGAIVGRTEHVVKSNYVSAWVDHVTKDNSPDYPPTPWLQIADGYQVGQQVIIQCFRPKAWPIDQGFRVQNLVDNNMNHAVGLWHGHYARYFWANKEWKLIYTNGAILS